MHPSASPSYAQHTCTRRVPFSHVIYHSNRFRPKWNHFSESVCLHKTKVRHIFVGKIARERCADCVDWASEWVFGRAKIQILLTYRINNSHWEGVWCCTDWAFPSHLIRTMLINGFLFYFSFSPIIAGRPSSSSFLAFIHSSNACANDNDNLRLPISIAAGAAADDVVVVLLPSPPHGTRSMIACVVFAFTPLINTKYLRRRL